MITFEPICRPTTMQCKASAMTPNANPDPPRTDAELEAALNAELADEPGRGGLEYQQFVAALLNQVKGVLPPSGTQQRVFEIEGPVPRNEPYLGLVQTTEIFLRLENKIYGPLDDDRLAELLTSGILTGYESVTRDFVRWTPVAYHPRIVLADSVDPDLTHDALSGVSDLPAPAPKREVVPEDPRTAAEPPLAVVFRKVPRPNAMRLPVVADLDDEPLKAVVERITGDHEVIVPIRQEEDPDAEPEATAVAAPEEATAEESPIVATPSTPPTSGRRGGKIVLILAVIIILAAVGVYFGLFQ